MAKHTAKVKPVTEVRIGRIKAAIWANDTEAGIRHNVTFTRLYRSDDGWETSMSFGRDDLLQLAKVADRAHDWIYAQAARSAGKPDELPLAPPDGEDTETDLPTDAIPF